MLVVESLSDTPVARRRQEIVERKGIGHPDTICDSIVEAISIELNRMYLDQLGAIPHYNVDKALLIAGRCAKAFGSGRVTQPMELIVGDRATSVVGRHALPVDEVARAAIVLDDLIRRFRSAPFALDWQLNCLDHSGHGTAGVYLTLTGTSAEDADSGQVGRGNRANGLIAFVRPTGGGHRRQEPGRPCRQDLSHAPGRAHGRSPTEGGQAC